MDLSKWFRERLGKRVHLDMQGITPQSWRIYTAGREIAVLVQPSVTKALDQVTIFYAGITRVADPEGAQESGAIVGHQWDAKGKRWIPLTLAELKGDPGPAAEWPDLPDHLPDDL